MYEAPCEIGCDGKCSPRAVRTEYSKLSERVLHSSARDKGIHQKHNASVQTASEFVRTFRLGTSHGSFRLITFAWNLSLVDFRLGSLNWKRSLEIFSLGTSI